MRRLVPLTVALAMTACVVYRVERPRRLSSFRLEIIDMDPFDNRPVGCEAAPMQGSPECPRPFAIGVAPVRVTLLAEALDESGQHFPWDGVAMVDVRAGRIAGVGPAGLLVELHGGFSQAFHVPVVLASGAVRIWLEDCGTPTAVGSFATGVSDTLFFDRPRIDQLNLTDDNTTSPLTPKPDNVCAISGDPRFGLGVDEDGQVTFVGYSHGRTVDAPPPAIGNFVEIVGCGRDEYDALAAQGQPCARGPLVVTTLDNAGFYVTDLNPEAVVRGFNHIYMFTFNYPENLQVGDLVLSLRGSPMEFTGSTQLRNPTWRRDGVRRGADLIPAPIHLEPDLYRDSLNTRRFAPCEGCSFGRNRSDALALESLEGAVVCMDNIAPASTLISCDANGSSRIDRAGCLIDGNLPPLCELNIGMAPAPPNCDQASVRSYCLPYSQTEIEGCGLDSFVPANPLEYCCERLCYNDFDCTEESAFTGFGQWVGDVYGRYDATTTDSGPVKMAFITREADPDLDPFAFGQAQRALPTASRQHLRIVGNLRQVLAARPAWVVVARYPSDITIQEESGPCP